MSNVSRAYDPDDPTVETRLIQPHEWARQRFGWAESVRRDHCISDKAKVVAHCLAFDFANADTARCDPRYIDIIDVIGGSEATIKRAIRDLVEANWIVRISGRGRGNASGYAFVTRAKIVRLKGVKNDPRKGVKSDLFYDPQKGSNLSLKGVKNEPPYNKDKPYKNHRGGQGQSDTKKAVSKSQPNPMVMQSAERAVAAFRAGRLDAITSEPQWVQDYIIAAELLTPKERQASGIF